MAVWPNDPEVIGLVITIERVEWNGPERRGSAAETGTKKSDESRFLPRLPQDISPGPTGEELLLES